MTTFLKRKKKFEKENHMKDLELTIGTTQLDTEVISLELQEENYISRNLKNSDSMKSAKVQRKRRVCLPKTVSTIISKAREKRMVRGVVRTNHETKENMKHIVEKLKVKLMESRLSNEIRGEVKKLDGIRFQKSSLSRIMLRGVKFVQKGDVHVEEEDTNGAVELCKKRILMGEKCRPLNSSGALHYDKDGIFVPDDVSSK